MKLKIGKTKKIIIIEIFVIIVMIIALISGIKISKLGKENVYKQSVEENIFEVEPDNLTYPESHHLFLETVKLKKKL